MFAAPGPLEPPSSLPHIQRGVWCALPPDDPVVGCLADHFWDRPEPPQGWEVARLSSAAYLYREVKTAWAVVAKFYAVKTHGSAQRHARREFDCTQQARGVGLDVGEVRAPVPLGARQGVLFLEYVDGLTLEGLIAVRRSRPGTLLPGLEQAARLLARLHTHGLRPDAAPDFDAAADYAHALIGDLTRHGVLEDDPITGAGLASQVERWRARPAMRQYVPTLNHGDATTSNFVFPWEGGVVAIDWERLEVADPAADLGRLMAEVLHSIKQHGGSVAEAVPDVEHLRDAYSRAVPGHWDVAALVERARFYQASSLLRIARNGWVSRLDRTALVAQALALLADR